MQVTVGRFVLLWVTLQGFDSPRLHLFCLGAAGDFLRLFPKTETLFPFPHRGWEFCLPQGLLSWVEPGNIGNMTAPYYQDDYVTLYHGDCLTAHREWLDADVLVTDPPYGMALATDFRTKESGRRQLKVPIHGDETPAARDAALNAWGERPGIVFGTWRVSRPVHTRNVIVWDKGNSPGVGNTDIPWGFSHEEIYVIGGWPARPLNGAPRRAGSVMRVEAINPSAADRPKHPTPKPIPLMERLIEKCPPGVIADPFAGAGATLLAAKNLGRRAIGIEFEERYCEIIAKRCQQEVLNFGDAA